MGVWHIDGAFSCVLERGHCGQRSGEMSMRRWKSAWRGQRTPGGSGDAGAQTGAQTGARVKWHRWGASFQHKDTRHE